MVLSLVLSGLSFGTALSADMPLDQKMQQSVVLFVGNASSVVHNSNKPIDASNKDIKPVIVDGRTLVPVRFISENMGARVDWDGATSTVNIIYADTKIRLKLGEKFIYVNDKANALDVPAQIVGGRTLIPLRAMSESLGKTVFWDSRGLIVLSDTAVFDANNDKASIDKIIQYFKDDTKEIIKYYVATTGDDSAAGTLAAPFKTIDKARSVVKPILAAGQKQNIEVIVRGGIYSPEKPIVLDDTDSGNNWYTVTYKNYPGEEAVITNAKTLTGWTLYKDNIYKVNVGGNFSPNCIYEGNETAMMARTPG